MKALSISASAGVMAISSLLLLADANPARILTGSDAFSTIKTEKPGTFRKLTPADLPAPNATRSVADFPRAVARPEGVIPQTLPGFSVNLYASALNTPRAMKQ